jgi:hypothetical protein
MCSEANILIREVVVEEILLYVAIVLIALCWVQGR